MSWINLHKLSGHCNITHSHSYHYKVLLYCTGHCNITHSHSYHYKVLLYITDNWAMIYAQKLAKKAKVPLCVCFCLVPTFLNATIRQYGFMIKGLQEVEKVSIV